MLAETGSIFVQINDEHLHLVRGLMDEVFGKDNCCGIVAFSKTSGQSARLLATVSDYLVWFSKAKDSVKYRQLYLDKAVGGVAGGEYNWVLLADGITRTVSDDEIENPDSLPAGSRVLRYADLTSQGATSGDQEFSFGGRKWTPPPNTHWKTSVEGLRRLGAKGRIHARKNSLAFIRFIDDFPATPITAAWADTGLAGRPGDKIYAVQTNPKVVLRCIAMCADP
jgi:adenine-specific DNA-methyltransferase